MAQMHSVWSFDLDWEGSGRGLLSKGAFLLDDQFAAVNNPTDDPSLGEPGACWPTFRTTYSR